VTRIRVSDVRLSTGADMARGKIIVAVILAVCLCACGPKKPSLAPLIMTIHIKPDKSANSGGIFWMVVKEVDENQFSNDTYEMIESIFLADERGPDVLGVCSVVPGEERQITVIRPSYRPAGFYFLLTDPHEYWKVLLKQPVGSKYDLRIEKYKASVAKRMSSW